MVAHDKTRLIGWLPNKNTPIGCIFIRQLLRSLFLKENLKVFSLYSESRLSQHEENAPHGFLQSKHKMKKCPAELTSVKITPHGEGLLKICNAS
jgi:hypothetical protein